MTYDRGFVTMCDECGSLMPCSEHRTWGRCKSCREPVKPSRAKLQHDQVRLSRSDIEFLVSRLFDTPLRLVEVAGAEEGTSNVTFGFVKRDKEKDQP